MIPTTFVSLLLLVVDLIVLVWVVRDAKRQGANPVAWGLAAAFLGPIGWVLYLFAGRLGGGSASLRRTILIRAQPEAVYKKCVQWIGLQDFDIAE